MYTCCPKSSTKVLCVRGAAVSFCHFCGDWCRINQNVSAIGQGIEHWSYLNAERVGDVPHSGWRQQFVASAHTHRLQSLSVNWVLQPSCKGARADPSQLCQLPFVHCMVGLACRIGIWNWVCHKCFEFVSPNVTSVKHYDTGVCSFDRRRFSITAKSILALSNGGAKILFIWDLCQELST